MGPEVVRELLARGHAVTVFNRGSRHPVWDGPVEQIVGDRDEPIELARLSDLHLDAIVDLSAYLPTQTASLLEIVGDVPRFVHCSTGAVYAPQPTLPWNEATPYGPWAAVWGTYAEAKLECENILRGSRSPSDETIFLRLPIVLGPLNYVPREEFVFNRLLDGAEILLPGDGKAVHQFLSTRQVGEAFANALDRPAGVGVIAYNVAPLDNLTSLEGFVSLCADTARVESRIRRLGGSSANQSFDAIDCVFPFPNENYILDGRAAERDGVAPNADPLNDILSRAFEALTQNSERRLWSRTQAENQYLSA